MTKLQVRMSVGVYGVFFDVFECVWVCMGVLVGTVQLLYSSNF